MLQRNVKRSLFLHLDGGTIQCIRSCMSSNGSVKKQAPHVRPQQQTVDKISQRDDALKFKVQTCNSLSDVSSSVSDQGELHQFSYIGKLLQQVRSSFIEQNGRQVEGDTGCEFEELLNSVILNNLTPFQLNNVLSLLKEINVIEWEAKSINLADKMSEQILYKLDSISPVEFDTFLQLLCCKEQVYLKVKSCVPNFDKLLVEKCLAIAEEQFIPEIVPSLVLALAKLGLNFQIHPAPILFQRVFLKFDSYSMEAISILGRLISHLSLRTSWYASRLVSYFQVHFDEVRTPLHLARLLHSTILLCSPKFKLEVWKKCQDVFQSSAVVDIDTLLSMMQTATFFDFEVKVQILESCSRLMVTQVGQMTAHQMVTYLSVSQHCFFKVEPLYQEVFERLKDSVSLLTSNRDIALAVDILCRQSHASEDCSRYIDRLMEVIDTEGTENLSKICSISARLRNQHPELITRVKTKCLEVLPTIKDEALLNTLARFLKLKSTSKSPEITLLREKLTRASYRSVTPREHSCVLTGFGKVATPPSKIDPFVWSKMINFLPNLCRQSSRMLFMMLGQARYFHINPVDHEQLCNLQCYIFQNILSKRPPNHLLLGGETIFSSQQNLVGGCDLMEGVRRFGDTEKQVSITKTNVVGVSLYLNHANFLYQDLVDLIADTVHSEVDWFTPYELKDVLSMLASSSSSLPVIDNISERFASSLVEFFDMFSPFFIIESALCLAQLQYFDQKLLEKIFTWQFLEKFEKLQPSPFSSHILMQLNRAVCLEFPEMQAPWFHHEIDHAIALKNPKWSTLKTNIYEALTEILGSDCEIKTQNHTDYNLFADFEFSYKKDNIDCSLHSSSTWNDTDKVILDILPRKCYFINTPQLKGEFSMKKRHLEILGYRYISIPQHDFRRSLLPFRSDKVDYLRKKLTLHH